MYSHLPLLLAAMINMVDLYLEGPRREKLESAIKSQNDLTGFAREAMRTYSLLFPNNKQSLKCGNTGLDPPFAGVYSKH